MPTWRNFAKHVYRCGLYEAQDILVEIDDVDLIRLDMTWEHALMNIGFERLSITTHSVS